MRRPPDRPRSAAGLGPRAPARFARRAGHHPGRRRHRALRAKGPPQPARGHPVAPLPARSAPGRLERRGPRGWRGDPLRVPHRRADLLLRRLPPRHRLLRHRRASPPITPRPSHATGSPGSSSPTTTIAAGDEAAKSLAAELMAVRHRVLPRPLPLRRRRQRRGHRGGQTADALGRLCTGRAVDGSGHGTRPAPASPIEGDAERPEGDEERLEGDADVLDQADVRIAEGDAVDTGRAVQGDVGDEPLSSSAAISPAADPRSSAGDRGVPRRAGGGGGTAALAGAPHPEGPLSGQPAGQRDGGGGRALPRRHRRPLLGQGTAPAFTEAAATELRAEREAIKAEARPGAPRGRRRSGGSNHRAAKRRGDRASTAAEARGRPLVAQLTRPDRPGRSTASPPSG